MNIEFCEHENIENNTQQTKTIGGKNFHYYSSKCIDCGAVLWDNKIEQQYTDWLKINNNFTIQFSIGENVRNGMRDILNNYPNVTESNFVRAAISITLNVIFPNMQDTNIINTLRKGVWYNELKNCKKREKMKARISPILLENLISFSEIMDVTQSKFVEECIIIIVALFFERENIKLWNDEIDKQIEIVLKAS